MKESKRKKFEPTLTASAVEVSLPKRRAFRWLAALVLPAVILVGLELVLRVLGLGHPTHFFVRTETGPTELYRENPKFGWRFFPRRLARAPDPVLTSRTKPAGTRRIFVLGESAALGDPEPAYGFSRILRELLEERCPGVKFEVFNVSMTAINSHAILPIAQDCVPFQADVWILYMGNNEVVGPFGAGSIFGLKAPPLWLIKASLAAKRTCLGQVLDAFWERASARRHAFQQWEGMKMMIHDQVCASDPALERVYGHFRRNLEDILALAARAGTKTILCSISSNLKDCPPFASLNTPTLSPARMAEWERLFTAGNQLEDRQSPGQALAVYRQAAEIDSTHAALAFRIARCELAAGKTGLAREQYARSRDLDALRFRADSQINRIIREIGGQRRQQGVTFADVEAWIANSDSSGIPGQDWFWDHVHFNFTGNYRVARGLTDCVLSLLPETVRHTAAGGRILTEAECAEPLAFTDWDQRAVLATMLRRCSEAPFTTQLDHSKRLQRWSELLDQLSGKLDRQGLANSVDGYRKALDRRDDDWVLHHRLAFLLEALGDFPGAEQQWRKVVEITPGYVDALFKLGEVMTSQSRFREAGDFYRKVLRLRPTSFESMNGLGLVLMEEGKLEEATRLIEQALRLQPQFTQGYINLGLIASRRGEMGEAEAHYRRALASDPRSTAAQIDLANLLAKQQKHAEAVTLYLDATRLKPAEATIHLSLANSLEAIGRSAEAAEQYREALRLNPRLPDAHFNLGVLLARQGDLPSATSCFEQTVRLSPDDPQAHLNLGVALAQQNRLREARAEFEAVLRLDAGNAAARRYLDAAMAKERSTP